MKMNVFLSKLAFETNIEVRFSLKEFHLVNSYTKQDTQTSDVLIQAEAISENYNFFTLVRR